MQRPTIESTKKVVGTMAYRPSVGATESNFDDESYSISKSTRLYAKLN